MDRQQYLDAYDDAMKRERELWVQVKGKGPGTPNFNKALWLEWLHAVSRTTAASKALRDAYTGDSKLGDLC